MELCTTVSTLYSMMCSAMLTDPFHDGDYGIPIGIDLIGSFSTSSSFLNTWVGVLQQKNWMKCLIHVIALISESASRRLK